MTLKTTVPTQERVPPRKCWRCQLPFGTNPQCDWCDAFRKFPHRFLPPAQPQEDAK